MGNNGFRAGGRKQHLFVAAFVVIVCNTLFADALVVQWYLMVWELIPLCPHPSGADARVEVGCGYCWCQKGHRGSCRSNSFLSSWTALSARRFLFWFLTCPRSMVILWCFNCWSTVSALNPGAGSMRTTAGGPSSGRIWTQSYSHSHTREFERGHAFT